MSPKLRPGGRTAIGRQPHSSVANPTPEGVCADAKGLTSEEHGSMSRTLDPAQPAPRASVYAPTLSATVIALGARHRGTALQVPVDGGTAKWTYSEVDLEIRRVARGLISLGIEPGDHVAVLGVTSPRWTIADCAVLAAAAVVVPIYHTNSAGECSYVLSHSCARAVLCEDVDQIAKVESVRTECPDLEHVLLL